MACPNVCKQEKQRGLLCRLLRRRYKLVLLGIQQERFTSVPLLKWAIFDRDKERIADEFSTISVLEARKIFRAYKRYAK